MATVATGTMAPTTRVQPVQQAGMHKNMEMKSHAVHEGPAHAKAPADAHSHVHDHVQGDEHGHEHPAPVASTADLKDPVCGMTVTERSPHHAEHEGLPYYFDPALVPRTSDG